MPRKGAGGENENFLLHLPKRGCNKTDSIAPLSGGRCRSFVVLGPRWAAEILPASPPLVGERQQILQSPVLLLKENSTTSHALQKILQSLVLFHREKHKTLQKILHSFVPTNPRQIGQHYPHRG